MCRSLSSDAENGNGAGSGDGSKSIAVAITDLRKTYAAADGSAKQVFRVHLFTSLNIICCMEYG